VKNSSKKMASKKRKKLKSEAREESPASESSENLSLAPVTTDSPATELHPTDMSTVIEESKAELAEAAKPKRKYTKRKAKEEAPEVQSAGLGQATLESVVAAPFQVASAMTGVQEVELSKPEATELAKQAERAISASGVDLNNPKLALYGFLFCFASVALGRYMVARKVMAGVPTTAMEPTQAPESEAPVADDRQLSFTETHGLKLTT
jgi:hypothetical protein